ncbi:hypothetical protein LOTGIDRAFT_238171 [Lottia gigantea]|uniref:G-protein coupled receptors family 1 profile domain-containing protein n=1 Tax=Lottia gigantea TaxID=225164 RepID=V4B290_LOTGI|nr:hypothetical protein LOTGIDRAFT_238171 [Lottia gigantea]ESP01791.1 hypothetical protein LOTGIDRAFT_238171 [Lottia gigantea]
MRFLKILRQMEIEKEQAYASVLMYMALGPTRTKQVYQDENYQRNEAVDKDNTMIALLVVWSILIILFNVILLVLIPCYWKLRASVKHMLMFSAAIADLVMGLVVCPLIADLGVNRKFLHGCSTQMSLQALSTIIVPSVTTWAVLLININYILRITSYYYCDLSQKIGMAISIAVTPWVLTVVILVPQLVAGVDERKCTLYFPSETARKAVIVTSFVPQCIGIFITFLVAFVMYLIRRDELVLDAAGERLQAPSDICLVSFLTLSMYLPKELLLLNQGFTQCTSEVECDALHWIRILGTWELLGKSFFVPLAWTFCHQLREAVRSLWEQATWNQKF